MLLETPRLYLRQFSIGDAKEFFDLNNDPDVIMFTGDKAFGSIDEAKEFLRNYQYKLIPGLKSNTAVGRWAMIGKEEENFIGWCGLKYVEETGEINIGYRLHKKYWGKNFASEAAIGCINFGLNEMKIPTILGRSMKANIASIRVLEKCGMSYWKDCEFLEHPGVYYRIQSDGVER